MLYGPGIRGGGGQFRYDTHEKNGLDMVHDEALEGIRGEILIAQIEVF